MSSNSNRITLKIDLSAIERNVKRLKERANNRKLMAIVKADGYGIGGVELSRYLESSVDFFGVATVAEGVELRLYGIAAPILVLGYVSKSEISDILFYNLTATVYSAESALEINRAGLGRKIPVHVAIDTGMSRLGFRFDELSEIIKVFSLDGLVIDGIFTHYASANCDVEFTRLQKERFDRCLNILKANGLSYGVTHASNSDGIVNFFDGYDMVRLGIGMYGISDKTEINLENPFLLEAEVVQVKTVKAGERVGYGGSFTADKPTKIATISAGYADGYPVYASNAATVKINGCFANVVGRVCMDYLMVDVTNIKDIHTGDKAVLFGEELDFSYWIKKFNTFPYEFLCHIGNRVGRVYIGN